MLAGHDFDALLMGSLYGELSAVEESRLQAHLQAHPGDQELWRGLMRTREAIRSSAALLVVEPPQAISARILQEAAHRAPKAQTGELGQGGLAARLGRWFSTFAAHPAMAAVAMAVVAVGVAGTMYARGNGEAASPKVAASSPAAPASEAQDAPAAEPAAASPEPPLPSGDSFAVGLANEAALSGDPHGGQPLEEGKARYKLDESTNRRRQATSDTRVAKPSKAPAKPAQKSRDYLPASTEDYEIPLKDLADEDRKEARPADDGFATAPPLVIAGKSESVSLEQAKPSVATGTTSSGASAPARRPGVAPAAPPAAAPAPRSSAPPSAAPVPAPEPSESEDSRSAGGTADKLEISERSEDRWAASEHARLVRLARANKCSEAAAVARSIAERAPRYYADRVTGDKELRACSSAIRDALNLRPDAKRKATRAGEADTRK